MSKPERFLLEIPDTPPLEKCKTSLRYAVNELYTTEWDYVNNIKTLIKVYADVLTPDLTTPVRHATPSAPVRGKNAVPRSRATSTRVQSRARTQSGMQVLSQYKSSIEPLSASEARAIFRDIESLVVINDFLLRDLQNRILSVDDTDRYRVQVGDILVQFAPHLKMYRHYFTAQDASDRLLVSLMATRPSLKRYINWAATLPRCKNLNLQSFLIRPIQRIPQMSLLVKEIIKCNTQLAKATQDSADIPDDLKEKLAQSFKAEISQCTEALAAIRQSASHIEKGIEKWQNQAKVMLLEKQFYPRQIFRQLDIRKRERFFVREGFIDLIHHKKGRRQYWFVLFSDLLVWGKPVSKGISLFKFVSQTIPIGVDEKYTLQDGELVNKGADVTTMTYVDGHNDLHTDEKSVRHADSSVVLLGDPDSLHLQFRSDSDRITWVQDIKAVVAARDDHRRKNDELMRQSGRFSAISPEENDANHSLGKLWQSNSKATKCPVCSRPFGVFTRKLRHCRLCGLCVCTSCSQKMIISKPGIQKPSKHVEIGANKGAISVKTAREQQRQSLKRQQKQEQHELLQQTSSGTGSTPKKDKGQKGLGKAWKSVRRGVDKLLGNKKSSDSTQIDTVEVDGITGYIRRVCDKCEVLHAEVVVGPIQRNDSMKRRQYSAPQTTTAAQRTVAEKREEPDPVAASNTGAGINSLPPSKPAAKPAAVDEARENSKTRTKPPPLPARDDWSDNEENDSDDNDGTDEEDVAVEKQAQQKHFEHRAQLLQQKRQQSLIHAASFRRKLIAASSSRRLLRQSSDQKTLPEQQTQSVEPVPESVPTQAGITGVEESKVASDVDGTVITSFPTDNEDRTELDVSIAHEPTLIAPEEEDAAIALIAEEAEKAAIEAHDLEAEKMHAQVDEQQLLRRQSTRHLVGRGRREQVPQSSVTGTNTGDSGQATGREEVGASTSHAGSDASVSSQAADILDNASSFEGAITGHLKSRGFRLPTQQQGAARVGYTASRRHFRSWTTQDEDYNSIMAAIRDTPALLSYSIAYSFLQHELQQQLPSSPLVSAGGHVDVEAFSIPTSISEQQHPSLESVSGQQFGDMACVAYHPHYFAKCRELLGLTTDHLLDSLSSALVGIAHNSQISNANSLEDADAQQDTSSMLNFRSKDSQVIVSTVSSDAKLQEILQAIPSYIAHLESHPDSLLDRYLLVMKIDLPAPIGPQNVVVKYNRLQLPEKLRLRRIHEARAGTVGAVSLTSLSTQHYRLKSKELRTRPANREFKNPLSGAAAAAAVRLRNAPGPDAGSIRHLGAMKTLKAFQTENAQVKFGPNTLQDLLNRLNNDVVCCVVQMYC